MEVGAIYLGNSNCRFTVWSPYAEKMYLHLFTPEEMTIQMEKTSRDYWTVKTKDTSPGSLYKFIIGKNGQTTELPDPASYFQPEGINGYSSVVSHNQYTWNDRDWKGIKQEELVIYELHVGTFTPEGTFESIIPRLQELQRLGINTIELMPIAQFSGGRNWGYDTVFPYAPQNTYGGPDGLKTLVDACHNMGIAVILDVIYNHLGPEGNVLFEYGPYTIPKYNTPWGDGINFDDSYSNEVRRYFGENALYWIRDYHIDGLRLDATHAIFDMSPVHFLRELEETVKNFVYSSGRECFLIAETNMNDTNLIHPQESGGLGIDAQWNDDFHHALYTLLSNENIGYYSDYGKIEDFAVAYRDGFVYSGQYSNFHKKNHGTSSKNIHPKHFVVFSDNHDQAGNRPEGERLSMLIPFEAQKLSAAAVILSPYIPLLFMGEEYGSQSPFYYFIDHSDPTLIEAVRQGRKEEFEHYNWKTKSPDPKDIKTFKESILDWNIRENGSHKALLDFYKELIQLRKSISSVRPKEQCKIEVSYSEENKTLLIYRKYKVLDILSIFYFGKKKGKITLGQFSDSMNILADREWIKILDTAEKKWKGPGSDYPELLRWGDKFHLMPYSVAVYQQKS